MSKRFEMAHTEGDVETHLGARAATMRARLVGALRDATVTGLLALGLFLPLIGFQTITDIRDVLILTTRWPLLLLASRLRTPTQTANRPFDVRSLTRARKHWNSHARSEKKSNEQNENAFGKRRKRLSGRRGKKRSLETQVSALAVSRLFSAPNGHDRTALALRRYTASPKMSRTMAVTAR